MNDSTALPRRPPWALVIALLQGLLLYALHRAVQQHVWPATQSAWLGSLYLVVIFIPVALQLLAPHLHSRGYWFYATLLSLLVWYAGWHVGTFMDDTIVSVADGAQRLEAAPDAIAPLGFVLAVWGLHVLPFLQCRLAAGRWTVDYPGLFANAWRNFIALAEAALFTALFWALLALWQVLFSRLGFDFFRELFTKPWFFYPVTTLVFGTALHLVGSIDRMVSAVLEQILNVFKWLAVIAGLLLALFSLALLPSLPALLGSGDRAIGANWLLWLVAILVLLLNAAYRDGNVERAYPRWLAQALRYIVPLMVLVAGTALYALIWRAARYGLTVPRVWGFIVSGALALYAVGYAWAALRKGRWFAAIGRVNVGIAAIMIIVVYLALTPLLSPYRLTANSQYRQILAGAPPASANVRNDRYALLRFETGAYGLRRLRQLGQLQDHPQAARIRERAAAALASRNRWNGMPGIAGDTSAAESALNRLAIHPSGRTIDAPLRTALVDTLMRPQYNYLANARATGNLHGLYIDLDAKAPEEFVLLGNMQDWHSVRRARAGNRLAVSSPRRSRPRAHHSTRR